MVVLSIGPLTHTEVLASISYGMLIGLVLLILDRVHVDLKAQWPNALHEDL